MRLTKCVNGHLYGMCPRCSGERKADSYNPPERNIVDLYQLENKMNQRVQPVVGWLVCIKGVNFGKFFALYGGKNFIGRSAEMDICLADDAAVSRIKHATIIYEPKQREFVIQSKEHELVYVNGLVVSSNMELNDHDVIVIGGSTFVFVPFCDQRYDWEILKCMNQGEETNPYKGWHEEIWDGIKVIVDWSRDNQEEQK